MAAVVNHSGEAAKNKSESKEFNVQNLVDMFTKLNPLAKEFFPSSYYHNQTKITDNFNKQTAGNENSSNKRGRRRHNGRAFRAQRDDSIRRTVYVSDIDQTVTEEQLAGLFSNCGQVVDCRVCGDPHSALRFAFVEFMNEDGTRAALNLDGTIVGFYPVRVLPSKTAILPVNPTFLPRSEDEREMCSRTVYCTNVDKKVSQADVKYFFESTCGEVTRLRLLGDQVHSTRIAFVEFAITIGSFAVKYLTAIPCGNVFCHWDGVYWPRREKGFDVEKAISMVSYGFEAIEDFYAKSSTPSLVGNVKIPVLFIQAESAVVALNCSGMVLGNQAISVSPSKTPVRPRVTRMTMH